jgi:hypothetical protein
MMKKQLTEMKRRIEICTNKNGQSLFAPDYSGVKKRFVVKALQPIAAFQDILVEEAFLTSPSSVSYQTLSETSIACRCFNSKCFQVVKKGINHVFKLLTFLGFKCPNKTCSAVFCNKECFSSFEPMHKQECGDEHLGTSFGLALRFLACKIDYPTLAAFPSWENFDETKNPEFAPRMKQFEDVSKAFETKFPNSKSILRILKTLNLLQVPLQCWIGGYTTGFALFQYFNYFNHSCSPNAYFFIDGKTVTIRSMRQIAPNEEITISYPPLEELFGDYQWRKRILNGYLGCSDCLCDRCSNEELREWEEGQNKEFSTQKW